MPPAHGGLVSFILCLGGRRFVPVWLLKVTCSSCMSVMRTLSFFVSCKCARPPVVVVVGHPAFVFCFPLFVHPDPPSSTTFRYHHHHRQQISFPITTFSTFKTSLSTTTLFTFLTTNTRFQSGSLGRGFAKGLLVYLFLDH